MTMNLPGGGCCPHHHDLFKVWSEEKAVPMVYSRKAVEAAAGFRITLKPA